MDAMPPLPRAAQSVRGPVVMYPTSIDHDRGKRIETARLCHRESPESTQKQGQAIALMIAAGAGGL